MPRSDLEAVVAALRELAAKGVEVVDEPTGKALLRAAGVATPAGRVVATAHEAAAAAAALGRPVGVKIACTGLAHKSDAGGVTGPLASPDDVREAATELLARFDGPLLVESWEARGEHCFVGLSLRGPLGPVVSVGLGGLWVEVLRDVAHRAAPVTAGEAADALATLRGAPLLNGGRGRRPTDVEAVAEAVARISRLALEPELCELVAEIDVNPLLARSAADPVALDCTIVLARHAPSPARVPVATGGAT